MGRVGGGGEDGQEGVGQGREGETGVVQWGGDWEGAMGRGRCRGGNLKGEMGGARGGGILQMDMMECLGGYRL